MALREIITFHPELNYGMLHTTVVNGMTVTFGFYGLMLPHTYYVVVSTHNHTFPHRNNQSNEESEDHNEARDLYNEITRLLELSR